ncbi:MAG: flagellar assembly protein FliW [Acidimicrobiia bacterium]|nr:flagellar assembly protein FliW [Acidimicrobiia bacterium]
MTIESSRFGALELERSQGIDFGPGLLGFPESGTYYLLDVPETGYYAWLQSGEEPEVAFLVTSPWDFFPDYELDVPDDVQDEISLSDPSDAEVLVLLTAHHDGGATALTANLLGPIVVNTRTRQARQIVLDDTRYTTRELLRAS